MSRSIVTANRITELPDENYFKSLDLVLTFTANCFESGIVEILKEVAEKELESIRILNNRNMLKGSLKK
ncbi:hypothetical protein [Bacillus sp. FJAT-50079]|uniref:hypothetical protein n=1 Tax=Bacillus sp. FJAT-50079 TaxID=2833577 RepID=UPI001BCA3371|nr:hypothetical protein [Bacillus sp. FJAT-50079]MBS4206592.1 hypothetical protein [Bacillus sp. FJAT-50079]